MNSLNSIQLTEAQKNLLRVGEAEILDDLQEMVEWQAASDIFYGGSLANPLPETLEGRLKLYNFELPMELISKIKDYYEAKKINSLNDVDNF